MCSDTSNKVKKKQYVQNIGNMQKCKCTSEIQYN